MNKKLKEYVIFDYETIIQALIQIDVNKQGFVVVVDKDDIVLGVLTDGDVRRAFIGGCIPTETVSSIYTRNAKTVSVLEGFEAVTELFKDQAIKFLPIVDQGRLVNVITKNQMHVLLLQDIHADLTYNFSELDTGVLDCEIFQKPWGFYKTTVLNDYYQGKILSVKPGGKLSLQSHCHREEHWVVVHGTGEVQLDESILTVSCGSSIFIPKGAKHRITNIDSVENLIITEVQIGGYLGENDIIRYEDVYGRA